MTTISECYSDHDEDIRTKGTCDFCGGPWPIERSAALAVPHAEVLANGRCVGVLEYAPLAGTVLTVIYCECDGAAHNFDF